MFKANKTWTDRLQDIRRDSVEPLSFLGYGPWKPIDRYIKMTVHSDCRAPHFLFEIIDVQVRSLITDTTVEELSREIKAVGIAFYPEYGTDFYLTLVALADGGYRGTYEEFAVNRVFHICFLEKYSELKKFFSGYWKSEDNPLPVVFPKYWEWQAHQ